METDVFQTSVVKGRASLTLFPPPLAQSVTADMIPVDTEISFCLVYCHSYLSKHLQTYILIYSMSQFMDIIYGPILSHVLMTPFHKDLIQY